jgi:DNA-binding PadR family transcriptional regulator
MPASMRRPLFFILLSLAETERHGSGIMRDVLDLTAGDLKLWPVTLYGSLDELVELGWIRSIEASRVGSAAESASARKRWFQITPSGRRALAAEVARLKGVVQVAQRRLAPSGDVS